MAGLGDNGSASDLLGSVLSPEADKEEKRPETAKEEATEDGAGDDNNYALRLQLLEYEELENSLPADLRPDENDLEARLALLRDIAQQQYYMQQQDGMQALMDGFEGGDEELFGGRMEDESELSGEEGTEEDEEMDMQGMMRVMDILRTAQSQGMSSLQSFALIQEHLSEMGLGVLAPQVDVDSMSYEELQELCDTVGKVNVGLAPGEIEKRTVKMTFSEDLDVLDKKCAVCMCELEEGDVMRHLSCPHVFHLDCIDKWLSESKKCPVCSVEVAPEGAVKPIIKKKVTKPPAEEPKPKKQKSTPPKASSPGQAEPKQEPKEKKKTTKKRKPAAKRDALLIR